MMLALIRNDSIESRSCREHGSVFSPGFSRRARVHFEYGQGQTKHVRAHLAPYTASHALPAPCQALPSWTAHSSAILQLSESPFNPNATALKPASQPPDSV